jgi:hypothetical protein
MDVKKTLLTQVMKLAQNPKVMEIAMSPRVMGAAMKVMSLRGQVESASAAATQSLARSLNLATREEVRELRRTVRRLEDELQDIERARDEERAASSADPDQA